MGAANRQHDGLTGRHGYHLWRGRDTETQCLVAAVTRGIYAIGADTDQVLSFPVAAPHLYMSVLKMISR